MRECSLPMTLLLVLGSLSAAAAPARLDGILEGLRSADGAARGKALGELTKLSARGLTEADALAAVKAAGTPFPADAQAAVPALLEAAAVGARPSLAPAVLEVFPRLPPSAQWRAFEVLGSIQDKRGAEAYLSLLGSKSPPATDIGVDALKAHPHDVEVFFPAMFDHLEHPLVAASVYSLALEWAGKGLLPRARLTAAAPKLLASFERLDAELAKHPYRGPSSNDDPAHHEPAIAMEYLLDVLGQVDDPKADGALRKALAYPRSQLALFAAKSLLDRGQPLDAAAVSRVAADPSTRARLFDMALKAKQPTLLPEKYRTQAALAESVMVRWLEYPTELGAPPTEIVLAKVVTRDGGADGPLDYFVFKFRTDQGSFAKDGWMAGLAGPFLRSEEPTTGDRGSTFSKFEKFSAATPEQIVDGIEALLEKSRRLRR